MYVYNPKRNVNYKLRNKTQGRRGPGRNRPMPTSSEIEAGKVKQRLREDEAEVSEILGAKHMLEVAKHMPAIREARKKGKKPRRVPKRVLATVERLKLV